MRFFRKDRVSSLIQERLSWIIVKEVEVPGALITITRVEVSKKINSAKVKVSVLPSEKALKALAVLANRAPYLEHLLLKDINIKPMPHIVFELDRGPEKAANIEKALLKDNNRDQ